MLGRVTRLLETRLGLRAYGGAIDEHTGLLGQGIGLDSIEALQLVAAAEEEFGLTVSDDELLPEHFQTVGTFIRFVEERLP
jgi:acyl carrier protein